MDSSARLLRSAEASVIERARRGDARAWASLYEECFEDLLRYVAYLVLDVAVAEDLVQEAFVIAFSSIGRYDPQAPFGAWVRGVAHNLVRRHWRSRSRREQAHARLRVVSEIATPSSSPEQQLNRTRQADALAQALESLPDNLREAFVLADVHGLPPGEAATMLGITPGNFRVRLHRARDKLRRLVQEESR